MSDPNDDVVLVIRREEAEKLQKALAGNLTGEETIDLLDELQDKLAEALRDS